MRGTIHLVTADDALVLRPLTQPVLDMEIARHSEFAPVLVDVDLTPVLEVAHPLLAATPMNGTKLRAALGERFPDHHAGALAYACRCKLALVQVPPRGVWGKTLQVTSTPLDTWVGRPLATDASIDEVVLRYLRAFGPATVADVASWSRLTRLREVVERLRTSLQTFVDEKGRELFDVPDGPRPDPDTPAPVRFLPEYDNLLLSHADRSRFQADGPGFEGVVGPVKGTVLVDGVVRAVWHSEVDKAKAGATLVVEHLRVPKGAVALDRGRGAPPGRVAPAIADREVVGVRSPDRSLRGAADERQQLGLHVGVVGHLDPWPVVAALAEHLVHRQHALEHRAHFSGSSVSSCPVARARSQRWRNTSPV